MLYHLQNIKKESAALRQGDKLKNRYEIQRILGAGGSSNVYLAYDKVQKKNRAIKEIRKSQGAVEEIHKIIMRQETELIMRLKYPYFPSVEEVVEEEEALYIVMEYLEGETLEQVLKRSGPQSQADVVRWARDMCLVLGYLHNCRPPVIYRDMKPGNIMLQPGGNLRLIDFGAVFTGDGDTPNLGTRGYAAPEQLAGERADARTDIYGLGVTMYHLLTGQEPGQVRDGAFQLRRCSRRLSRKLDRIVRRCTRPNPDQRYPSCEDLRKDLENFANRKKL